MDLERFAKLAGVPLHYDRFTRDQYGTEGTPFEPWIETGFAKELDACFKELGRKFKPRLGDLQIVVSGGVGREGTGSSMHHQNKAFDLDGLVFQDAHLISTDFPSEPHLYLAVEAVLRKHFGVVLAYDYNKAHEDHFHIDNSRSPGFRRDTRSHSIFVQNLLTFVYDLPVIRDGVWGDETDDAHRRLRKRLGLEGFSKKENWLKFCDLSVEHALKRLVTPPPRHVFA